VASSTGPKISICPESVYGRQYARVAGHDLALLVRHVEGEVRKRAFSLKTQVVAPRGL
jgi:hypothetical protein